MLELINNTLWGAGLYPGWDRSSRTQMTLVIKAGFWFSDCGELIPMKSPPLIEESDRFYEESGDSSLAAACDTVPYKDGAELLLFGTAYPPKGATVMEVSVTLRRDEDDYWQKTLRIYGPRAWRSGLIGVSLSQPGTLEPLPLRYEFAYGGRDPRNEMQRYDKNPVGVGYSHHSRYHKALSVPQIETAGTSLNSLTQRPEPGGFGPLPTFWEPRIKHQPDLDEERLSMSLCPFVEDVKPAFYHSAPTDQRFTEPFAGTESILLKGLLNKDDGENAVMIHLPQVSPKIGLHKDGARTALEARCDTLVVNTDAREIHLVWRTGIAHTLTDTTPGWVILDENNPADEEEVTS